MCSVDPIRSIEILRKIKPIRPTKENKVNNRILILDIDGCISPSPFPHLGNNTDDRCIDEIRNRIRGTKLFPNFLLYHMKVKPLKTIFITRRKESHFKEATEKQLGELISETKPIYYHEDLEHTREHYLNFKAFVITDLLISLTKEYPETLIEIFDDIDEYFKTIHLFFATQCKDDCIHPNFITYQIQSDEDWKNPRSHIKYITPNPTAFRRR